MQLKEENNKRRQSAEIFMFLLLDIVRIEKNIDNWEINIKFKK